MSDPDSEGMGALASKMASVMGEIDYVPKNGWNDFHNYEYSSDDDVMQALRPVLAKHNLAVFHSVKDRDVKKVETSNGTAWKTIITLEITIVDGDSGQSWTGTWIGEADDGQDKGLYKAYTSGIKYWALKAFLLSADSDVETHDTAASSGSSASSGSGIRTTPLNRNDEDVRWPNLSNEDRQQLRKADFWLLRQPNEEIAGAVQKVSGRVSGHWADEMLDAHRHRAQSGDYPSEGQIKRLYAIADGHDVEALVEDGWGYESLEAIPNRLVYDTIAFQLMDPTYAELDL